MQSDLRTMAEHMDGVAWAVVIVAAIMSIYSIGVMIERYYTYNQATKQSRKYAPEVARFLKQGKIKEAIDASHGNSVKHSHLAKVLVVGLQEWQYRHERGDTDEEAAKRAMQRAAAANIADLTRRLAGLATIGSVALLVSLGAALLGIIYASSYAAVPGGTAAVSVASTRALITMVSGLMVAVLAVLAYSRFLRRVEGFNAEIEDLARDIETANPGLGSLAYAGVVPRGSVLRHLSARPTMPGFLGVNTALPPAFESRVKWSAIELGRDLPYTEEHIYYATDRERTGKPRKRTGQVPVRKIYGAERNKGGLEYGMCTVSVPIHRTVGGLQRPSVSRFEFRAKPSKHICLVQVDIFRSGQEFMASVKDGVDESVDKDVLVFIHGYKVRFADAAERTAQLKHDLGFGGPAICYSWPSRGRFLGYWADESSAEWTAAHLKEFLTDLAKDSGAARIHLVAHSMGGRPLTTALKEMVLQTNWSQAQHFNQVVLAAPDIDSGMFGDLAGHLQGAGARVTVYASSKDRALWWSMKLHRFDRVGQTGAKFRVFEGVDTIDASRVDTSLLGHAYYGSSKSVLSDIFCLLRHDSPPSHRFALDERQKDLQTYWAFLP